MIGPATPFSQQLHAEKYRGPGESFDDFTVRFARAANDGESHFRALLDALRDQRLLPAGRMQLAVGRPHRITAFNCLRADTEIMTNRGFKPLYELARHREVNVLSPVSGQFERAVAKSYGVQPLNRIVISKTFRRNGETFNVFATPNHRWVLQTGEVVTSLKPGDILKAADSRIPMDAAGFVHGLVFGDGSKSHDNDRYVLRLCRDKTRHLTVIREHSDVVSETHQRRIETVMFWFGCDVATT